ncbi:hypothetical protein ACFQZ1_23400 [Bacillus sp. CGMCC 1.60114]
MKDEERITEGSFTFSNTFAFVMLSPFWGVLQFLITGNKKYF